MKRSTRNHSLRNERGASTVEFALVLPALMLIIFGIIEFGRIFMVHQMLNSAAREGARIACLPGADNASVQEAIDLELASAGLAADGCQFTPSDVSTAGRNDPITIRIQINYTSIAWSPGFVPGLSSMLLESVVVMRKEGFS